MTIRLRGRLCQTMSAGLALCVAAICVFGLTTRGAADDRTSAETRLRQLVEIAEGTRLETSESRSGASTFLNRDYQMQEVPAELIGKPRWVFDGGSGNGIRLQFRQPAVVFAAFEYNASGAWSFEDGRSPSETGWHLWRKAAYRGTSNGEKNGRPHHADVWFREFKAGQELSGLPPWWLCLGVVDLPTANAIDGFEAGLVSETALPVRRFSHAAAAAQPRPLHVPEFQSLADFRQWQARQRQKFVDRFLYPYDGAIEFSPGEETQHETHRRHEMSVELDGQRLFRYFRLEPVGSREEKRLPTIVCFMGHGKVAQILDEPDSYQHACAAEFAKAGYLVFAMENAGMEPGRDTHHDLDQSLRLDGYGWYSLLFAHQRMLLDRVFADPVVDPTRVGSTGVSTGGLLTLSAAAMEPRIAAASVQGIFGSMRVSFIRDRSRHCTCGAIPGLLPEFDLPELALLVAPRPLHISNGERDGFSPQEAKRCIELISPLYEKMGGDRPQMTISPGGHEFSLPSALEFFAAELRKPD
jgi:hypothetical protein